MQLFKETDADIMVAKGETAEDRRILWITYDNLRTWFNNWENDLFELGFATKDTNNGQVIIPEEQLSRIISMDNIGWK